MSFSLLTFLENCERFNYSERKREAVKYGCQSKKDADVRKILEDLFDGPLYHKFLALETCYGSQEVSLALRALFVPSKLLKERALIVIFLFGTDSEILSALKSLPDRSQIHGIRRLRTLRRRRQRPQVIDLFLDDLRQDPERSSNFRKVLPLGSQKYVNQHLTSVAERLDAYDYSRLATFHPMIAQEALRKWAIRSKDEDPNYTFWRIVNQTISTWASLDATSDMASELIQIIDSPTSLSRIRWSTSLDELALTRPLKVVELILGFEDKMEVASRLRPRTLKEIPVELLLSLQSRYRNAVSQSDFPKLMPEQRRAVFPMLRNSWTTDKGEISAQIVAALPEDLRRAEARRHMRLHVYAESPSQRIPYISFLPWEEAIKEMAPFLRSREASVRASALYWQLEGVKYDDSHIDEALQLVIQHRNEQSPVRDKMMEALSKIPSSRFNDSHLAHLELIIRQALDASDLSSISVSFIQALLAGLVGFHSQWAADQIALIVREQGLETMTSPVRLNGINPDEDILEIFNIVIDPLIEVSVLKKEVKQLLVVAKAWEAKRKPAHEWSGLLDALEKLLQSYDDDPDDTYAQAAGSIIEILGKMRPKSLWLKVPSWVERRSCLLKQPNIFRYIHAHQQNLLLPYLSESFVFSPQDCNPLESLRCGFERWTHSQQEQFVARLVKAVETREITSKQRQIYIKQLARLQFVDQHRLIEFANSKTPIIRDVALRALGRLDGDEGVPTLIEALTDERARIAIYALRNKLLLTSKPQALTLLRSVPLKRVSIAKEVVRLIGELKTNEAFESLIEIGRMGFSKDLEPDAGKGSKETSQLDEDSSSSEPKRLHVDIRRALIDTMQLYLDREEAWEFFMESAQDADINIAKAVLWIHEDGSFLKSPDRIFPIILLLLRHHSLEVRLAALQRCRDLPLQFSRDVFVPRLLELLQSKSDKEMESAARILFQSQGRNNLDFVGKVFTLALNDRRSLLILNKTYLKYVSASLPARRYMDATTLNVLSILSKDRLTGFLRLRLMFAGLPLGSIRKLLLEMIPELHADNLILAESLIRDCLKKWNTAETEQFEFELAANQDDRARRLAVEILTASVKEEGGWTRERRGRLEKYREDDSVLVAESAWKQNLPEWEI